MRKSNTLIAGIWLEPNSRNVCAIPPTYEELLYTDGQRRSDIGLLLHQKEVGTVTDVQLLELAQQLMKPNLKGSPFSGWSDDQLLSICKSRRCNTFHDLKEYIDWLSSSSEKAKHQRESFVADLKAKEQYDELRKQIGGKTSSE